MQLSWPAAANVPLIGRRDTQLPHRSPSVQQDSSQSHPHAAVSLQAQPIASLTTRVPTHSCGLCDGPYADDSHSTWRVIRAVLWDYPGTSLLALGIDAGHKTVHPLHWAFRPSLPFPLSYNPIFMPNFLSL